MKILKLKSILFSLMAIAMVTVFLTSCEEDKLPLPTDNIQKNEIPSTLENYMKEGQETAFYLPLELKDADEETIKQYLLNVTAEQIEEMEESYRIENYLVSIDRLDEVHNDLGQIDLLTQSDLSKYLSEQEIADFNSFEVNSEIELRGCTELYSICYFNPLNGKYRKATAKFCIYDWYKTKMVYTYSYHNNSSCK